MYSVQFSALYCCIPVVYTVLSFHTKHYLLNSAQVLQCILKSTVYKWEILMIIMCMSNKTIILFFFESEDINMQLNYKPNAQMCAVGSDEDGT